MLGSRVKLGSRITLGSRVMLGEVTQMRSDHQRAVGTHLNIAMSKLTSRMLATSRKMTRRTNTSQLA